MRDYKLLPCPFCGCEVRSGGDEFISGSHPDWCYFHFVDHQDDYNFFNQHHLDLLLKAWNTRAQISRDMEHKEILS